MKIVETNSIAVIYSLSLLGILYGIYNIIKVISIEPKVIKQEEKEQNPDNDQENLIFQTRLNLTQEQVNKLAKISNLISQGSIVFLLWEYLCLLVFIAVFGSLIFMTSEHINNTAYTTFAFIIGALTSILCGFIGMRIATASNYRTAYKAQ